MGRGKFNPQKFIFFWKNRIKKNILKENELKRFSVAKGLNQNRIREILIDFSD